MAEYTQCYVYLSKCHKGSNNQILDLFSTNDDNDIKNYDDYEIDIIKLWWWSLNRYYDDSDIEIMMMILKW